MQTKAIRLHDYGGPEKLKWESIPLEEPGRNEARVRHTAVGLNFIDTYHRNGLYPVSLPATLGMEAAGVVEAVGHDVEDFKEGDRVCYGSLLGAYSERRNAAADRLVNLPEGIDDETAAAMMLKGLTAHYLVLRTFAVREGQTVLIHAASGGVGLILCQWAKALGARVIGTVGNDRKAALAAEHGCDHPIVYTREDFVKQVHDLTEGKGVPVVYDGVGKATFDQSLDCLSPLGMMVSYGNASGPVPPFSILTLSEKGSLFLARPTLKTYIATRPALLEACRELFEVVSTGAVRINVGQRFPLRETAKAHREIESRATVGSTVLVPGL